MRLPLPYKDEFVLMQNFAAGERAAFTAIYRHEWLAIYNFARKYLEVEADAKDATAETFLKLWNERNQLNDLDHVKAFLRTTVRNHCIDQLRHSRVKSEKHADILRQITETGEKQVQLEQLRAELMQLVYAEVDKLPARMKQIFLLSYKEGLKPAEIADRLGLSVQTVWNQKAGAINLLKQALGNNTLLLALLLCLDASGFGPQNGLS